MKKLLIIATIAILFGACSNTSQEKEKASLKEVITVHDQVMDREEKLMQHKMELDTLLKVTTDTMQRAAIANVTAKLMKADAAMGTWMQNFNPSAGFKTHEEKMAYLAQQKKAVLAVDSQLQAAVKASEEYLNKNKK